MNNGLLGLHKGWAIARRFDWGWSFLGPGWFGWGLPKHADAMRTAVFSTKVEAQAALRKCRDEAKFKITKVIITVAENRHWKF